MVRFLTLALLLFVATQCSNCEELQGSDVLPERSLSVESRFTSESNGTDDNSCGAQLQRKFDCAEYDCLDRVAGYINYLDFFYCGTGSNVGLQFLVFVMFLIWALFLLHVVETTTNDYFCTSLQLVVAILKMSPNVAGVTFLAVGNAACDVIASIAAFATGAPKVGVGTTIGAGIFVTCAVVAAVSFVTDVRLARRSFVRDVVFFIGTVLYLLFVTLDGVITLVESIGFVVIYILFVAVVAGGRWFRALRTEDEGSSAFGSTGGEAASALEDHTLKAPLVGVSSGTPFQASSPPTSGAGGGAGAVVVDGSLGALDAARRAALVASYQRENSKVMQQDFFLQTPNAFAEDDDDDDGADGDLGNGDGETAAQLKSPMAADEDDDPIMGGGLTPGSGPGPRRHGGSRTASFVDDVPKKSSKWIRSFQTTQEASSGSSHAPHQWPKYHKRKLVRAIIKQLGEKGSTVIPSADGGAHSIDLAELYARDPDAAMELAAAMASAVTTAAMHHQLTYKEAAAAVSRVALQQRDAAASGVVVPVADVLAVLPHETVKPVARWYQLIKGFFGVIGPYYHAFMHYAEIPLVVGRRLTVPLMHQGSYRRRLIVVTAPFSFSFFVVIFSTHILKGIPTQIGGFPYWVMAFLAGLCYSAALHFYLLPQKSNTAKRDDETGTRQALLHGAADAHADAPVDQSGSAGGSGHDGASNDHGASAHGHGKHRPWYKKLGILIAGPNDQPVPTGIMMWLLLTMSFVMSLFWLLLIATEIVGVAICFGKVLNIPDIVMGLTVLAVGNSINDLSASITIAREGYPSMAVAGAYAGPMFNVLAGIGLPMIIYCTSAPSHSYNIGKDTPLVLTSFAALLASLTITLLWVPFEGWRLTHRIGRFLLVWFFLFVIAVVIVGMAGLSPEDAVAVVE